MSGWHRENPDYMETGAQPPDPLEIADWHRAEQRDNPQPCANCGKLSSKRWCSDSCFYTEDGGGDPEGYR